MAVIRRDRDFHVVPLNDLREHVEAEQCWCAPTRDPKNRRVLVHHAADMREHFEPEGAVLPERPRG